MKRFFLPFVFLCLVYNVTFARQTKVYVLRLDSEIHAKSARMLDKAMKAAGDWDANVFLLHLNTYGGALDAADKMRTALLGASFITVAFVDHQAASAGALISIACDSIYMAPGSSIGSATVVDAQGNQMPEKYQSFMRSMMRATAEQTGRDPVIAEQMVDGERIVNFTAKEAVEAGFSEGQADDMEEVMALLGYENTVTREYKETWLDKLIGFFLLPLVQGLLLMGMVGGIFFELKTPGVGFPLGLAVFCAICYFSPLFLEGLAQYWEFLIVVLGLIFLALEIFITPGFGVLGILGIIGVFTGLTLSMIDNWVFRFEGPFNWNAVLNPFAVVSVSGFAAVAGFIYLLGRLYPTRAFNFIALRTNLKVDEGFVGVPVYENISAGQEGIALTDLRPAGKVSVNGKRLEARAAVGFITRNTKVKVVRVEGGVIFVETL